MKEGIHQQMRDLVSNTRKHEGLMWEDMAARMGCYSHTLTRFVHSEDTSIALSHIEYFAKNYGSGLYIIASGEPLKGPWCHILWALRKEANLSGIYLADHVGIDRKSLTNAERGPKGKNATTTRTASKLFDYYGVALGTDPTEQPSTHFHGIPLHQRVGGPLQEAIYALDL